MKSKLKTGFKDRLGRDIRDGDQVIYKPDGVWFHIIETVAYNDKTKKWKLLYIDLTESVVSDFKYHPTMRVICR